MPIISLSGVIDFMPARAQTPAKIRQLLSKQAITELLYLHFPRILAVSLALLLTLCASAQSYPASKRRTYREQLVGIDPNCAGL